MRTAFRKTNTVHGCRVSPQSSAVSRCRTSKVESARNNNGNSISSRTSPIRVQLRLITLRITGEGEAEGTAKGKTEVEAEVRAPRTTAVMMDQHRSWHVPVNVIIVGLPDIGLGNVLGGLLRKVDQVERDRDRNKR